MVVFAIRWHESALGIHVFPILNPRSHLPSHLIPRSSQCTSPEHPVSCIEPGLVICFTYDNIHVSVLSSQIIPPSSSHTEPKGCYLHLCLFCCFIYRIIVTIFLNSIYMRQYTVLVFFFLTYFTLYNRLQINKCP